MPHVTKIFSKHCSVSVCTCEVEGEGDEAVVFAEDAKRLLPLHQREEVVCDGLTIEEVVHTQQEVPVARMVGTKVQFSQLQ